MKKTGKENIKLAKELFKSSFISNELDTKSVKENIRVVKDVYRSSAVGILKGYLALINRYIKGKTLIIETPKQLEKTKIDWIRIHFEKETGQKLITEIVHNPKILAGLRITLSDNRWDYSLRGKITQIRDTLHGKYSS